MDGEVLSDLRVYSLPNSRGWVLLIIPLYSEEAEVQRELDTCRRSHSSPSSRCLKIRRRASVRASADHGGCARQAGLQPPCTPSNPSPSSSASLKFGSVHWMRGSSLEQDQAALPALSSQKGPLQLIATPSSLLPQGVLQSVVLAEPS